MVRRRSAAVAVAMVVAGTSLAAGGVAGAAGGAPKKLTAKLSGKKEVPDPGRGRGTARLTLDAAKGEVCFNIKLRRVGETAAGHIHKGGPDEAGPVFIGLFDQPTRNPKGCAEAKKSQIRAVLRNPGNYYVNVHTAKFPAGAARGQLR